MRMRPVITTQEEEACFTQREMQISACFINDDQVTMAFKGTGKILMSSLSRLHQFNEMTAGKTWVPVMKINMGCTELLSFSMVSICTQIL